jgi:predicted glutamine amidotransferase
MCGIYGWSFPSRETMLPERKMRTLVFLLALEMDERGGSGWGVHFPSTTIKGVGEAWNNIPFEQLAREPVMYGHTRYPTVGDERIDNSHPFEHRHIVGAHNGSVWNHRELERRYKRSFNVDSQHIFEHLADDLPVKDIEGYGTIEWMDRRDEQCIHLARWNNGDLSLWKLDKGGWVWASTSFAVQTALEAVHLSGKPVAVHQRRHMLISSDGTLRDMGKLPFQKDRPVGFGKHWGTHTAWEGYGGGYGADEGDWDRVGYTIIHKDGTRERKYWSNGTIKSATSSCSVDRSAPKRLETDTTSIADAYDPDLNCPDALPWAECCGEYEFCHRIYERALKSGSTEADAIIKATAEADPDAPPVSDTPLVMSQPLSENSKEANRSLIREWLKAKTESGELLNGTKENRS